MALVLSSSFMFHMVRIATAPQVPLRISPARAANPSLASSSISPLHHRHQPELCCPKQRIFPPCSLALLAPLPVQPVCLDRSLPTATGPPLIGRRVSQTTNPKNNPWNLDSAAPALSALHLTILDHPPRRDAAAGSFTTCGLRTARKLRLENTDSLIRQPPAANCSPPAIPPRLTANLETTTKTWRLRRRQRQWQPAQSEGPHSDSRPSASCPHEHS
ncbi:hypothetical protein TgHK011_005727 [Trichoderma gracile]|nr:hypothetical protein TgHK011_005727 [Trichoderma gracile]